MAIFDLTLDRILVALEPSRLAWTEDCTIRSGYSENFRLSTDKDTTFGLIFAGLFELLESFAGLCCEH